MESNFSEMAASFGKMITFFFTLAGVNYFLKRLLGKDNKLVIFFTAYHRWFGLAAVLALLGHFALATYYVKASWSGGIAAVLMLVLAGLGYYGHYVKQKEPGVWVRLHRWAAILVILGMVLHAVWL